MTNKSRVRLPSPVVDGDGGRRTGVLLADHDGSTALPDVGELERRHEASVTCYQSLGPGDDSAEVTARRAIHAQVISIAVRAVAGGMTGQRRLPWWR